MSNKSYNTTGDYSTFKGKIERADGVVCQKLDILYHTSDSRVWSAIINPSKESIIVTFHYNKTDLGDASFDVLANQKEFMGVDGEFIFDVLEQLIAQPELETTTEQ
jgi:hypothetical protein